MDWDIIVPIGQFDQGVDARKSLVLVTKGAEGDQVVDNVSSFSVPWNKEPLPVSDFLNLITEYEVKFVGHGFLFKMLQG